MGLSAITGLSCSFDYAHDLTHSALYAVARCLCMYVSRFVLTNFGIVSKRLKASIIFHRRSYSLIILIFSLSKIPIRVILTGH